MREFIAVLLTLGLIIVLVMFIVSMVKPKANFNKKIFKSEGRKKLATYYSGLLVVVFVLIALVAPTQPDTEQLNSAGGDTQDTVQQTDNTSNEVDGLEEAKLSELYDVVKVVDGDTIDVSIEGETTRLRLIGIDTPETVDPRKPVQCFGNEASSKAKELLEGKKVRLESDDSQDNRDKYDRLLRYVYLEDGTMYNKTIIAEGYAHEYTYNVPYKYQSAFKQAQKEAEEAEKGLWSPNTCNGDTEQSVEKETQVSTPPANTTPTQAQPPQSSNCDPNYTPCIPNVSYDLDCGDISTSVRVIGNDRHRFDRDGDGYGCESN